MNIKVVLFGEYLLRLTPPGAEKLIQADSLEMHWAGSEANIGVSLSLLGDYATFITSLPENELSATGIAQLHKYGLATSLVGKKEGRVGLYFYETGVGARSGRVLYDRNYSAFSHLQPGEINWDEIFDDAGWFHWSGITPSLNAALAELSEEALKAASKKGLIISADFNYRSTLWQYGKHCSEVMPHLLQYCDVLLADVDTSKLYFNITPSPDNLVADTFLQLSQKLPRCKTIAMTMRQQIAAGAYKYCGHLFKDGLLFNSKRYDISQVAERIGTGDAFMAGLIYSLRTQQPPQQVVDFATACGVIKHSITGDFNLTTLREVETLIAQSGTGKIFR